MNKEANTTVFHLHKEENIPESLLIIFLNLNGRFRASVFIQSAHLAKRASGLLRFHAGVEKKENAAIISPYVAVSTVTCLFTWQACFPAPDKRIHVRRYRCDEVSRPCEEKQCACWEAQGTLPRPVQHCSLLVILQLFGQTRRWRRTHRELFVPFSCCEKKAGS